MENVRVFTIVILLASAADCPAINHSSTARAGTRTPVLAEAVNNVPAAPTAKKTAPPLEKRKALLQTAMLLVVLVLALFVIMALKAR